MSMAPFGTRPVSPQSERRRTRLALAIASLGIAATLLAYAVSPGVRHAVSHAAHSVKHAVSRVLDHDAAKHARAKHAIKRPAPANTTTTTQPLQRAKHVPAQRRSAQPPARTTGGTTAPG
jgi:hypothetical protein